MSKKKKETLMDATKDTLKLGITSNVGLGAMGAIGNIPGMPTQASNITGTVGAGLGLVNVGRLAKTGMTIADQFENQIKKGKKR